MSYWLACLGFGGKGKENVIKILPFGAVSDMTDPECDLPEKLI
jgi:hypothetical protein